jgi:hypothetical protein
VQAFTHLVAADEETRQYAPGVLLVKRGVFPEGFQDGGLFVGEGYFLFDIPDARAFG